MTSQKRHVEGSESLQSLRNEAFPCISRHFEADLLHAGMDSDAMDVEQVHVSVVAPDAVSVGWAGGGTELEPLCRNVL